MIHPGVSGQHLGGHGGQALADAIAAAVAFLDGKTPEQTHTYNNNVIEVPAKPSAVVTVTKDNVKAAIIDSGYYPATDFTGLQ